jgi:hypothetical protein
MFQAQVLCANGLYFLDDPRACMCVCVGGGGSSHIPGMCEIKTSIIVNCYSQHKRISVHILIVYSFLPVLY